MENNNNTKVNIDIDEINNTHCNHLSNYTKNRIIVYYNDGLSINDIAEKIGIHRNTVSKWIHRYKFANDDGLKRKEGTGKNKKQNNNHDINVINIVLNNKYISLREILEALSKENINVSTYKIRKILADYGYVYGLPSRHVPLTEYNKQKRLEFAIRYMKIDWKKVIFTDECSIWKSLKQLKRWYNNDLGIDYDVVFKHSQKINIWGAISYNAVKKIHIFNENMDADIHIDILKKHFLCIYRNDMFFQYDNDPKHTASKSLKFIQKNKINTIIFPSYSPDLNPIENIWSVLKTELHHHYQKNDTFENIVTNAWNKIDHTIINNAIMTMENRLKKIIANKGDYIDY